MIFLYVYAKIFPFSEVRMDCSSSVVLGNTSLSMVVPKEQLLDGSLQLQSNSEKLFSEWTKQDHADSYSLMQRVAQVWQHNHRTDQYLIYSKADPTPFKWEIVPYQTCRTCIGRIVQQLQVLWRIVFGGIKVSEENSKKQSEQYRSLFESAPETVEPSDRPSRGSDAFCRDDVIERQLVIRGEKVNVLFNYAPIGFGGERLHFLVVPKQHRETFTDVTREEYSESLELTSKLIGYFTATRETIKNVYLLNKTGIDAGQTVRHWHLQVIFCTNNAQDFWGKLTVFKNILFGSSPMKGAALEKRVLELRKELAK
jgi:diadenosine tetraphosphate (Ap4A) HIT family hydrolase